MHDNRRVRTILYADQPIEPFELDLLHTPSIQRLYDLHQLGLADRVFVDASHSRLQHVVGVMHQVDNIVGAMVRNLEAHPERELKYRNLPIPGLIEPELAKATPLAKMSARDAASYMSRRRRATRLMGLLHDLTHAPYGHTLEDEIKLERPKHDDPLRQAEAFYRLLLEYIAWTAADLGLLNRAMDTEKPNWWSNVQAGKLSTFLSDGPVAEAPSDASMITFASKLAGELIAGRLYDGKTFPGRGPLPSDVAKGFIDMRFAMRGLLWLDALHKDKLDYLVPSAAAMTAKNQGTPAAPKLDSTSIPADGATDFEKLLDGALAAAGIAVQPAEKFYLPRDAVFLDVIGNTICADLLDYAKRDAHHAGLRLDYDVDRIVENFTIVSHYKPRKPTTHKQRHGFDPFWRTAISVFSHKLRLDMPGELMNLLQIRFYVYQRVLFHPTKCIAGAMLGSALQRIGWKRLPSHFRYLGDAVFLDHARSAAVMVRGLLPIDNQATKNKKVADEPVLAPELASSLRERLNSIPRLSTMAAAVQLLSDREGQPIRTIRTDLSAGIDLLDRLSARRYFRPVFRLLPNADVSHLNLNIEQIAAVFLDASIRADTERLIESLAELPPGTVAIHCPPGDGPKKVAEMLVMTLRKGEERAFPLRRLSRIDPEIFSTHERAIRSLERMYSSMWRLVVSVDPAFICDYRRLNGHISRALYVSLAGMSYETVYGKTVSFSDDDAARVPHVANDPLMTEELKLQEDRGKTTVAPQIMLDYPDGTRDQRTTAWMRVASLATERLAEFSEDIANYVNTGRVAAWEGDKAHLEQELERLILNPTPVKQPTGKRMGADNRDKTSGDRLGEGKSKSVAPAPSQSQLPLDGAGKTATDGE